VLRSRPRPDAGSSHLRNVKRSYKPALFSSLLNRFCNTIIPTLKPRDLNREERVVFQSTDLENLHALYESRGLNPSKIHLFFVSLVLKATTAVVPLAETKS
jgi:hypothetical protein